MFPLWRLLATGSAFGLSDLRSALEALARALYLFAPLLLAAALSAVVHRWELWPALRRPIDGGATHRGRRVFGDGKTWRGVVVGVTGCIVGVAAQTPLQPHAPGWLQVVDYRHVNPLAFGLAMGWGAMLGELPNSFVKRQLGIPRGGTAASGWRRALFYVWDQVDLVIGAWPFVGWWVHPTAGLVVASFVVALALHPLVARLGFAMGARATAR